MYHVVIKRFSDGSLEEVGKMRTYDKEGHVTVSAPGRDILPDHKMLMVLAGIRFYYISNSFSKIAVPVELPSSMPPGVPSAPSLAVLENMREIQIRLSCIDINHRRYIEILDHANKIALLVASQKYNDQQMVMDYFKDIFGKTQFYVKNGLEDTFSKVFRHDNVCIGRVQGNNLYEAGTVLPIMTHNESRPRQRVPQALFFDINGDVLLADAADDYRGKSISVRFSAVANFGAERKALILARIINLMATDFKSSDYHILRLVENYPYRALQQPTQQE